MMGALGGSGRGTYGIAEARPSYFQLSMGVWEFQVILGRMLLKGNAIGVLKGL
jgi:hypothetical protein